MAPKRKKKRTIRPDSIQWCLDSIDVLTFKRYIEKFDCLDRARAQQHYTYFLNHYLDKKNNPQHARVVDEYKTWINTAEYQLFWTQRTQLGMNLKTKRGCQEYISNVAEKQMDEAIAVSRSDMSGNLNNVENDGINNDNDKDDDDNNTNNNSTSDNDSDSLLDNSTNDNNSDNISNYESGITLLQDDEFDQNNVWNFDGINIHTLFSKYQQHVQQLIGQHQTLPLETYLCEIAALTHVLVLNKNQYSPTAVDLFSFDLLEKLTTFTSRKMMDYDMLLDDEIYLDLTKFITDLSMGTSTRKDTKLDLMLMASELEYGQRCLIDGLSDMIQKLPTLPLKNNTDISETELWNTYFDPLLNSIISDPSRLVHLRWTDKTAPEGGKLRPDAIISKLEQFEYSDTLGYGEVKINQGNSKWSLCQDLLRLIIFSKNTIDVNKLDATLAFQIHGFNITFYFIRLDHEGIYTMFEAAHLRFPQSLEDLPSFVSLKNIKLLLGINNAFWKYCKKSADPGAISSRYRKTLPMLEDLIDNSKDKNRNCTIRFGQ